MQQLFNFWLDKRIDHRRWECQLSRRELDYAATDAFAHLMISLFTSTVTSYGAGKLSFTFTFHPQLHDIQVGSSSTGGLQVTKALSSKDMMMVLPGDVLKSVDGDPVESVAGFEQALRSMRSTSSVLVFERLQARPSGTLSEGAFSRQAACYRHESSQTRAGDTSAIDAALGSPQDAEEEADPDTAAEASAAGEDDEELPEGEGETTHPDGTFLAHPKAQDTIYLISATCTKSHTGSSTTTTRTKDIAAKSSAITAACRQIDIYHASSRTSSLDLGASFSSEQRKVLCGTKYRLRTGTILCTLHCISPPHIGDPRPC